MLRVLLLLVALATASPVPTAAEGRLKLVQEFLWLVCMPNCQVQAIVTGACSLALLGFGPLILEISYNFSEL